MLNEDNVSITSHTKLITYLDICKNRSNDDKRNVSQVLGWQTMGHFRVTESALPFVITKRFCRYANKVSL